MALLAFDGQKLARDLEGLPALCRTAFAAAAAERLKPAYVSFAHQTGYGDAATLTALLDRVWTDLEGTQSKTEQEAEIERCMNLIPQEPEEHWGIEHGYAQRAAMAVAYALTGRQNGEAQEAVWAANCAYEALDLFVIEQEGIDTNLAGAEQRVLFHPLIQAELSRQQHDLQELSAGETDFATLVERLRTRAQADSATVFRRAKGIDVPDETR